MSKIIGYRTVQEPAPANPEHPRYVPVIDEAQPEIVRRIFREYIAGCGLTNIAAGFNRDGISAPFDGHPTD